MNSPETGTTRSTNNRASRPDGALVDSYIDLLVEIQELRAQKQALVVRLVELLDENQLLRDDAVTAPVPFTIVGGTTDHLTVVPTQRAAGSES